MSLLNEYTKSYPLDIRFLNEDHENTLYISNDLQSLTVEITNVSEEPVQFNAPDAEQGPDEFNHITVVFKPDILDTSQGEITLASESDWVMGEGINATNSSMLVPFQLTKENTLQPSQKTTIELTNLNADSSSGARVTQVQFQVNGICFESDTANLIQFNTTSQLNILNQRGKKNIPLHFGFAGSNTVLNDGQQMSELTLQITNTSSGNKPIDITFNPDSETTNKSYFTVSFTPSDEANAENGLAAASVLADIDIRSIDNWECQKDTLTENPYWTINPASTFQTMGGGEFLQFPIVNIISDAPTGVTYMKINYYNIPGYWDGDVMIPIMKQPLVMRTLPFNDDKSKGSIVGVGLMPDSPGVTIDDGSVYDGNLIVKGHIQSYGKIADMTGTTIPVGGIIMWSGDEKLIPMGWALCNGLNDTPDLRDRFVMGAGANYNPGDGGGQEKIKLSSEQLPKHNHNVRLGNADDSTLDGEHEHKLLVDCGDGGDYGEESIYNMIKVSGYDNYVANHKALVDTETSEHTHQIYQDDVGDNQEIDIRPQYYALCFIMKKPHLPPKETTVESTVE